MIKTDLVTTNKDYVMSDAELDQVNGGLIGWIAKKVALAVVGDVIHNIKSDEYQQLNDREKAMSLIQSFSSHIDSIRSIIVGARKAGEPTMVACLSVPASKLIANPKVRCAFEAGIKRLEKWIQSLPD